MRQTQPSFRNESVIFLVRLFFESAADPIVLESVFWGVKTGMMNKPVLHVHPQTAFNREVRTFSNTAIKWNRPVSS